MVYVIQDQDGTAVPSWSCSQAVSKPVWHIPLLCVQCKTPDDGKRNCLKHVEFYSRNEFEKLIHLVGFFIGTHQKPYSVSWILNTLTIYLLTWRIWWALNNASKWQMRFNSAFKGLRCLLSTLYRHVYVISTCLRYIDISTLYRHVCVISTCRM